MLIVSVAFVAYKTTNNKIQKKEPLKKAQNNKVVNVAGSVD